MPYEKVAEDRPAFFWDEFDKVLLNFFRRFRVSEAESSGQTFDVSIHNDAFWGAKDFAEDNVCSFSADAGQLNEGIQLSWDFACVVFQQCLCTALDVLGLGSKKAGGLDELFQFSQRDFCVVLGDFTPSEQGFCD